MSTCRLCICKKACRGGPEGLRRRLVIHVVLSSCRRKPLGDWALYVCAQVIVENKNGKRKEGGRCKRKKWLFSRRESGKMLTFRVIEEIVLLHVKLFDLT